MADIAEQHPNLRPAVASHPNAYPELLDWLESEGDPAVNAVISARRAAARRKSLKSRVRGLSVRTAQIVLCLAICAVIAAGAFWPGLTPLPVGEQSLSLVSVALIAVFGTATSGPTMAAIAHGLLALLCLGTAIVSWLICVVIVLLKGDERLAARIGTILGIAWFVGGGAFATTWAWELPWLTSADPAVGVATFDFGFTSFPVVVFTILTVLWAIVAEWRNGQRTTTWRAWLLIGVSRLALASWLLFIGVAPIAHWTEGSTGQPILVVLVGSLLTSEGAMVATSIAVLLCGLGVLITVLLTLAGVRRQKVPWIGFGTAFLQFAGCIAAMVFMANADIAYQTLNPQVAGPLLTPYRPDAIAFATTLLLALVLVAAILLYRRGRPRDQVNPVELAAEGVVANG